MTRRTISRGATDISSAGKSADRKIPASGEVPRDEAALERRVEEPVESLCPVCHGAGFIYSSAPVGHPDYGKAVPCTCSAEKAEEKRTRLIRVSNLSGLERFAFENIIPDGRSQDPANQMLFKKAVEVAREYAKNPEGWLVFLGPSGCGKTHLAAAIANERLKQGANTFFVTVSNLLDHLRSAFNPGSPVSYDILFEQVQKVPLLILDDLGISASGGYTTWAREKLFQILDYRFINKLPLVVTSTLNLEDIEDKIRTRLSDPASSIVMTLEESSLQLLSQIDSLDLSLLKNMTFENFDAEGLHLKPEQRISLQEAYRLAKNFAVKPEDWLVFLGGNGCGKTHLAAAIANCRRRLGQPVLFVIVPDLLDLLRSTYSSENSSAYELLEKLKREPLLILDDFGTEASTPWSQEKLYQLINYRYNARLPTVITSYFNLDQIESRFSSRMGDSNLSTAIAITAPDYRIDRPRQAEPPHRTARKQWRKQSY